MRSYHGVDKAGKQVDVTEMLGGTCVVVYDYVRYDQGLSYETVVAYFKSIQ